MDEHIAEPQTQAQAQTPAQTQTLTDRFEQDRTHLRSVAYRMLGSLSEAEDALQDAWLRASRADISDVENLGGWLTTVVARVCLNMLRTRRTRGEDPLDEVTPDADTGGPDQEEGRPDPEQEAVMADSVGHALLVVLDTLSPAERLAFVLHDMFAVPFDQIAPMIERTPATARQLASRARRRVKGGTTAPAPDLARRRQVAQAFLAATREGNFEALVTLLHPDVVLRADKAVVPSPSPSSSAAPSRSPRPRWPRSAAPASPAWPWSTEPPASPWPRTAACAWHSASPSPTTRSRRSTSSRNRPA